MDTLDSSSSRYRTGFHSPPVDAADEPRDAEIQATLAEAEALVLGEQFRPALRLIVKAINMCPCEPASEGKERHPKDKSCHIDQCMLAVNSGDPYALFEVAKSPCTCGYRWPSCTHQHHAAALDALANCLDRDAQYVAAFAAALAIIRLDPASAMGYCRGARIIRYLLKSGSPPGDSAKGRAVAIIFNQFTDASSPLFLRAVLKRFVRGGMCIIDRHRRNPKDTYNAVLRRMAYHLDCDDARMDPVKEFPMEIIGLVFSHLDITDLGRCLRVSKQWNRVAQQDNSWNDLRLKRPGNPGKSFANFLQQHGRMRSLVISDATWFSLTGLKLHQMMFGLPQLDRLCIGFGKRAFVPPILKSVATKATIRPKCRLTQLSLESFDLQSPLFTQLLSFHANTLVTLNLARTGPLLSAVFDKIALPNLKKLRLTAVLQSTLRPASELIEMKPVVIATPNLEQLHLDGFRAAWLRDGPPTDHWNGLWSSLRRLTLGPAMLCVVVPRSRLWSPRFLPPFPTSLQSLEILSANDNVARSVLFTTASPATAINATALIDGDLMDLNLPQLEVFRCLSSILKPRHLEHILKPSVSAGKLQALELRAAFNHLTPPNGGDQPGGFVPARDLDFLTCSSLHTLGLHDFNFFENPSGRWVATNEFQAEPFVEWLDCFPSLHTLGVYPGDWEAVGLLIPRLIARPGIKAIHQQYLRGLSWDEAQKLARKHGVELSHSPAHMPAGWRVFEDFDDDTST